MTIFSAVSRQFVPVFVVAMAVLLGGCSTVASKDADGSSPPVAEGPRDPLEGFNRAVYTFNDKFDRYLTKPVAQGYRYVLPEFARKGVSNFFSNLRDPVIMVNNLLQGKFTDAA